MVDLNQVQIGETVQFSQEDLTQFVPFEESQVGDFVQFSEEELNAFTPAQQTSDTHTYFREETGKVVSGELGLKGKELEFLDDTQNNNIKTGDYLGFVNTVEKNISAFGRGAQSIVAALPQVEAGLKLEFAETFKQELEKDIGFFDVARAFLPGTKGLAQRQRFLNAIGIGDKKEGLAKSKDMIRASNNLIESNRRYLKNNNLIRPEGAEGVFFDIGGVGTTIFASIGLSLVTKSSGPAVILFSTLQKSDSYIEAREKGFSVDAASNISSVLGAGEGALEAFGVNIFLRAFKNSKPVNRVIFRTLEEAAQEGSQQTFEEITTQITGLRDVDITGGIGRVAYSMALGSLGGASVASVVEAGTAIAREEKVSPETVNTMAKKIVENSTEIEKETTDMVNDQASPIKSDLKAEKETAKIIKDFQEGIEIDTTGIEIDAPPVLTEELTEVEVAQRKAAERILETGEKRKERTDKEIIEGRKKKLDEEIKTVERDISNISEKINIAVEQEKPTVALEKRVDKLIDKRNTLSAELENISDIGVVKAVSFDEQKAIQAANEVIKERIEAGDITQAQVIFDINETLKDVGIKREEGGDLFPVQFEINQEILDKFPKGAVEDDEIQISLDEMPEESLKQEQFFLPDFASKDDFEVTVRLGDEGLENTRAEIDVKDFKDFEKKAQQEEIGFRKITNFEDINTTENHSAMAVAFKSILDDLNIEHTTTQNIGIGSSDYFFIENPADPEDDFKIRFSDHGNISQLRSPPDVNVATDGTNDSFDDALKFLRKKIIPKPIEKKKIITKGEKLKKLDVKITSESIKALNVGFRKGSVAKAKDIKNVQKIFDASQKEIRATIKNLPIKASEKKEFLELVDRAFAGKTKAVQTPAQLERKLVSLQVKLTSKLETKRKKQLLGSIKNIIKGVKPKIQSRRKIGKLDEKISDEIEKLTEVLSLSVGDAKTRLDAILTFDETGAPLDSIETMLLALKADPDIVDVSQAERLLLDIDTFIETGKRARKIKQIEKRLELNELGDTAAESIISDETISSLDESGMKSLFRGFGQDIDGFLDFAHSSWSNILEKTFDVKGANNDQLIETLSVTRNFQERKKIARVWSEDYQQRAMEAFDFNTEKQLLDRLYEDTKLIDIGSFDDAAGTRTRLQLTKAQIRQLWMIRQDRTLDRRDAAFGKNFNKIMTITMETAAFEHMNAGDFKAAQSKLNLYSDIRTPINTVFQKVNGASFANIKNYSPIRSKFTEKDPRTDGFLKEQQTRAGITKGSLKERTRNQFAIKLEGDDGIIQRHIYEMSHYMAFAEKMNDINIVFNNAKLKKSIEEKYGRILPKVIDGFVTDFTSGSVVEATLLGKFINRFNSAFASSVLVLKPSITVKQFSSGPALAETMPTSEYIKGSVLFWKNPIKNSRELFNLSELLKERGGNPEKDIAEIANSRSVLDFRKKQSYKRFLGMNIEIGDKGAIVANGWPVFNYHKNVLGKSTEEAIAEFEKVVAQTQQSSDLDQLSGLQRAGAFGRTLTQFMSAPMAYLRRELRAIRRLRRGKAPLSEFGKTIFIYHFFIPSMFQFIADFFAWDKEHQLRAMVLGSFNAFFLAGDMTYNMVSGLIGDREYDLDAVNFLGALDEIRRGMGDMIEGMFEEDADEILDGTKDMFEGTGKLLGVPIEQGFNFVKGAEKFIEGDVVPGSALMLGWPSSKVKELENE